MPAQVCLNLDGGGQKTDGGITVPTKLGDPCSQYPDDPDNPANPPYGSWCGFPDGFKNQGNYKGLVFKSRNPYSLQFYSTLLNTCTAYLLKENAPAGSNNYSSIVPAIVLQMSIVRDFDPVSVTHIFFEGCGSNGNGIIFGGYVNNVPRKGTAATKSTDISAIPSGITIDGNKKTSGLLIAMTDI